MKKGLFFKAAALALAFSAFFGATFAGYSIIKAANSAGAQSSGDVITVLSPSRNAVLQLDSAEVADFYANYEAGYGLNFYGRGEVLLTNPVTFEWECENGLYYQLYLAESLDFKGAEKFLTVEKKVTIKNLIPEKIYYWKVKVTDNGGKQTFSKIYRFSTKGSYRTITIDGVSNARDLGGFKTSDGKVTKYGIVFRSANVDSITENGIKEVRRLGIRTDVDLRGPEAAKTSPLKGDVKLIPFDGAYNDGHKKGVNGDMAYRRAFRDEIKVFADETNYPVLFHCAVGRDRTGTLAGVLLALCGVSREDIMREWELSYLSERGTCDNVAVNHLAFDAMFRNSIQTYPGADLSEKTANFLKDLGVEDGDEQSKKDAITDEQIAAIRRIMVG